MWRHRVCVTAAIAPTVCSGQQSKDGPKVPERTKEKTEILGGMTTMAVPLCSDREIAWNGFWEFVDLLIWCRPQRRLSLFLSLLFILGSLSLFYLFFILSLVSHFRKPTVSFSHSFL
jgi:hypothetical protein